MEYVRKNEVTRGSFDELQAQSVFFNENNDCAVKAVAVVCGVSYLDALLALKKLGRKHRCGTYREQTLGAVKSFGFTPKRDLNFVSDRIDELHARNYVVKNLTTRQLTMFPSLVGEGTWLIFTNGHVSAIKDGIVHCWGAQRALHIKEVYSIL